MEQTVEVSLDERGRLRVPVEAARSMGLEPGMRLVAEATEQGGLELRIDETPYQWLEPKPAKRTRQLGIKGRNMTVWNLVQPVLVGGQSAEAVAKDFRLPVDAIREALDYYSVNREWIDAEVESTARRLGLR